MSDEGTTEPPDSEDPMDQPHLQLVSDGADDAEPKPAEPGDGDSEPTSDHPSEQPVRPWERPVLFDEAPGETEESEHGEPDAQDDGEKADDSGSDAPGSEELASLADGPTSLDDLADDVYTASVTKEYEGLAESVDEAATQQHEKTAVSAAMAGVESGVIGFEDVTGEAGPSTEEVEAATQAQRSDLALRVASGFVLLVLFVASLVLGGWWFTGFIALVMVLALGEFYAAVRKRGFVPVSIFGLLGVLSIAVGAHVSGTMAIPGFFIAVAVAVGLFYSLTVRREPLANASLTLFGLTWVALLGFAVVVGTNESAAPLIFAVVLITGMFDIVSYFVGRYFGRNKLAPNLSPRKTVEGLIGGVFAALIAGLLVGAIPSFAPIDMRGALLLAVVIAVLAPLGDAAESAVKRTLNLKDMGSILPGHGGLIDRIDGLLFAVPGAYLLFILLGYV